jgi:hypothetical protein
MFEENKTKVGNRQNQAFGAEIKGAGLYGVKFVFVADALQDGVETIQYRYPVKEITPWIYPFV